MKKRKVVKKSKVPVKPPTNPLKLDFTDEKGNKLDPNSDEAADQFAQKYRRMKETQLKMTKEWERFISFLEDNESAGSGFVKAMLEGGLPEKDVASKLGLYAMNRINMTRFHREGVSVPLDTSTMHTIWSLLCNAMTETTVYQPVNNPVFDRARRTKCASMKNAVKNYGMGILSNQADPLRRAEVDALLHSDHLHLYSPIQLISLFYIEFVLFHGPRVRQEAWNVTRGEFFPQFNADGTVLCVAYVPRRGLKKAQGDTSSTSNRSSYVFKRPAAMPCPSEPKLDFWTVLQVLFKELDKLPFDGDRSKQRIFYRVKQARPRDGSSYFLPSKMGEDSFDKLLTNALDNSGIMTEGTKISNQSLRVTGFNLHDLLGLSDADMAVAHGHSSDKTNRIYRYVLVQYFICLDSHPSSFHSFRRWRSRTSYKTSFLGGKMESSRC